MSLKVSGGDSSTKFDALLYRYKIIFVGFICKFFSEDQLRLQKQSTCFVVSLK
jgi:hypothetical protein